MSYQLGTKNYTIQIVTKSTLEQAFAQQQWCLAYLYDRWATTPPVGDTTVWYFVDEADATLFRLRWS